MILLSAPEIESLRNIASSAGAEAVKICGAGGGGCVMIWSSPDKKQEVEEACQKKQVSSSSSKSSAQRKKLEGKAPSDWLKSSLKVHRFIGLALGGGKADRASLAVIEYYPNQKKIFLSHLIEKYRVILKFLRIKLLSIPFKQTKQS